MIHFFIVIKSRTEHVKVTYFGQSWLIVSNFHKIYEKTPRQKKI